MKKEEYYCDGCDKPFDSNDAYVLDHISLDGNAIMGDNRIPRIKHFCRDCFEKIIKLFPPKSL